MKVDFKVKVWQRVTIECDLSKEKIEQIRNDIASGKISCANDLYDDNDISDHLSFENLDETESMMTVEENDGRPVIDIVEEVEDEEDYEDEYKYEGNEDPLEF